MQLKNLIDFKDSRFIFDVLTRDGKEARFIGGCVRDVLMGRDVKDIDIATVLHPDAIEKLFNTLPRVKVIDIGKEYGTVMVVVNHHSYEITTLRRDVHTDGRYAVVEYTDDWLEDASRRDFTINGMSYSPQEDRLYDYFNGQEDLKSGLIKFIGDPHKRVEEDYLRILRLFRFYTYCGKKIDAASLAACTSNIKNMDILSRERKMSELYRIIAHKDYMASLELMEANGILAHVSALPDWTQGLDICEKLEKICSSYGCKFELILKIFAIFHKDGITTSQISREFLTLSHDEKNHLTSLSKLIAAATIENIISKLHYFVYHYQKVIENGFLYLLAKEKQLSYGEYFQELVKLAGTSLPKFPLTGIDIMESFSLKQGKELGKLLDIAKNFWIDSKFEAEKDSIIAYLRQIQ